MGVRNTVRQRFRNRSPTSTPRFVLEDQSPYPDPSPIVARLRSASALATIPPQAGEEGPYAPAISTDGTVCDSRPPMRIGSMRRARPVAGSVSRNTPQTVAGPSAGL
jgi:hypothetical protein